MMLLVDACSSLTGWTATGGASVALNEVPEFCAGQPASILASFGGAGGAIEKVFSTPVPVDDFRQFCLHVWSQKLKGCGLGLAPTGGFAYRLDLGAAEGWYLPTPTTFEHVTASFGGLTEIDRIKVTALTDAPDHLVVSSLVAFTDEYPLDIFRGTAEGIRAVLDERFSRKWLISSGLVATAGDRWLETPLEHPLIEKYATVEIVEGGVSEIHQLGDNEEERWLLTSRHDGDTIRNDYTAADVYLYIPVAWGEWAKEVHLPGIDIWGMAPEPILRGSKLTEVWESYRTDGTVERMRGRQILKYTLIVDCQSSEKQLDVLADMSEAVRVWAAREKLWVNGKPHYIEFTGSPTWVEPTNGYNETMAVKWEFTVEVQEDVFTRMTAPVTKTQTFDIEARQ